jgi:hypothetical protein
VILMSYDFEVVKGLYDKYGINFNEQTKQYEIKDRQTNQVYSFDGLGAEKVKFAHFWVYSTKYGHSTTTPDGSTLTQEEYDRAFNEFSREAYNIIMSTEVQAIQATGRSCRLEVLEEELKSASYAHAQDIARGLFSKPNGHASFETWCQCASKETTLEEWMTQGRQM